MLTNGVVTDHLGKMLEENYFLPRKLTIYRVAKDTGIEKETICKVLTGRQPLRVKEAVLLARYFGEKEDFFAEMQLQYELRSEKQDMEEAVRG